MAKINKSDYHRWASRKSTSFLTRFVERFAGLHARAQLLQTELEYKPPKYMERKLKAAIHELKQHT